MTLFDFLAEVPRLDFAALQSADGRRWIDGLADLTDNVCRQWNLTLEAGEARHGFHSVVVPVSRHNVECVLKLAWPANSIVGEGLALRAWAGRGAVRLFDADVPRGVLLLERLDPAHSLAGVPPLAAAEQAGSLLRHLSVPAPSGIRRADEDIDAMVRSIQSRRQGRTRPPAHWVDTAISTAESIARDAGETLVHGDLHYENVLRGKRRRWLAVDPKPVAGHPERAVAELLFTRVDELASPDEIRHLLSVVVEAGRLDAQRAVMWAFVRTIDYWLWGLEQGLTVDPLRCDRVVAALAPLLS